MMRRFPIWVSAALWLVLVVGALATLGWWVWSRLQATHAELQAVEPRVARLAGLAAERGRLEAAVTQATAAIGRHAYPASLDASQAGNDAQQRARDTFSKAGLDVVSIQVLPVKSLPQYDRIPMTLRLEGELGALQAAFAAMPLLAPSLFVEGFNFQGTPTSRVDVPVRIVVQVEMFVLRVKT